VVQKYRSLLRALSLRRAVVLFNTLHEMTGCFSGESVGRECNSHGNPLHNIPLNLAFRPVIEAGGTSIGVTSQVLYILTRHALFQQVSDSCRAEGVGRVE